MTQLKKIREIYLTAGDEDESLVWCEDKVTDEDVKYIRADILKSSLLSQREELRREIEIMQKQTNDYGRLSAFEDVLEKL